MMWTLLMQQCEEFASPCEQRRSLEAHTVTKAGLISLFSSTTKKKKMSSPFTETLCLHTDIYFYK